MDKYDETFETWNKIAKAYQDKFMNLDLYNDTYHAFCELLGKQNPNILEIGCGPGNITKHLLIKRPDFKITAIDVSPNMISLARENNPTANFKVMDCRNIDKIEYTFDAIICGFCLPYLSESDCSKLIDDCHQLLSGRGLLYLSFVEGDEEKSGFQTGSNGLRVYFQYHRLTRLKAELSENGFDSIDVTHKNYLKPDAVQEVHTMLIARKSAKPA